MIKLRRPRSIRGRVTLTALVAFALVLGTGALVTLQGIRAKALDDLTDQVATAARKASVIADDGPRIDTIPPTNRIIRLQIVDRAGAVIAASPAMRGQPPMTAARPSGGDSRVDTTSCTSTSEGARTCFAIVGVRNRVSAYGDVMVYAAGIYPPLLSTSVLGVSLTFFCLALLGLLGWVTWHMIGRTLEPVARIRAELAEINASDLSRRMSVSEPRDEVAELTEAVNATLGRLERAVENQRRFASDASHELRTPLTGLRTKLELALADPEAEDPRATIRSALGDAERLQAIVDDLLLLARLDAGVHASPEEIDLAALVTMEVEQRPCRHRMILDLQPDVTVRGNRLQLARLLTNLLANADRHAMSEVQVHVCTADGEAVLEVTDDGLGIPPEERERVFQRFTRLDSARSRDAGGTGLGLPIARDIAAAHRGRLYAADSANGRGARLILRLPLTTSVTV
ncbi:signal transduction histidine kinase [Streptosporangium becharense]|uniref:histidine kinase n=1 Tax=Streptosporangium becharense TaxID=1816182 RepID=A0A7W9MHK2_9ACTN|nr:ATP-binding protein [Streptosporangium becharense]MBB2912627.1 signal transduction histidine kinase [Streptosporangium becharense]MBB5820544.1 signal transduction histidine kinase [Streptosporangium becharense]